MPSSRACVAALSIAMLTLGCDAPTSPGEEHMLAVAETERWADAHPNGWTVQVAGNDAPRYESWSQDCSGSPPSGRMALRVEAKRTRLEVLFRCTNGTPKGIAAMRAALEDIVVEELPHGMRVPNWSFRVVMSSALVANSIDIREAPGGRIVFSVHRNMFSLYGHSDRGSCSPPADAPSEPQCYVQREHRIPLTLEVAVPMDAGMFK